MFLKKEKKKVHWCLLSTWLLSGAIGQDICNAGEVFGPSVICKVVEPAAEASKLLLLLLLCQRLWLWLLLVWTPQFDYLWQTDIIKTRPYATALELPKPHGLNLAYDDPTEHLSTDIIRGKREADDTDISVLKVTNFANPTVADRPLDLHHILE